MRHFTQEELKDVFEKHKKWLNHEGGGVRADLRGADLRGANLYRAILYRANLCGADLREADLREANLCGAILREANLRGADLREADLREADLREADLREANLREANLREANLCGAILREAILRGAILREAILCGADLREANLREANLREANLRGADLRGAKKPHVPLTCPEEGSFIGFKSVRDGLIVKLLIPEDAKRSSATSRKCRCNKAKVLSITNMDGSDAAVKKAFSKYDDKFEYVVGKTVSVKDFDEDRWNECAPGIHFFITRQEAVEY